MPFCKFDVRITLIFALIYSELYIDIHDLYINEKTSFFPVLNIQHIFNLKMMLNVPSASL